MLFPSGIEILNIDHAWQVSALFLISAYMVEFAFLEYYYVSLPLCNREHTAGF